MAAWLLQNSLKATATRPSAPAPPGCPISPRSYNAKPLTFMQAALFQWVNPKAWMMILTGVATFTQPQNFTLSAAIVAGAFLIVGLPLISSWNLFGAALKNWLQEGQRLRGFNRAMAILLVASLYPTFGIQPSLAGEAESRPAQEKPQPPRSGNA